MGSENCKNSVQCIRYVHKYDHYLEVKHYRDGTENATIITEERYDMGKVKQLHQAKIERDLDTLAFSDLTVAEEEALMATMFTDLERHARIQEESKRSRYMMQGFLWGIVTSFCIWIVFSTIN